MISSKEMVCEIIDLWKLGEYGLARSLLMIYKPLLPLNIYFYLYKKMGIVEKEVIPEILIEAQKIMGGKIFDQYDNEIGKKERLKEENRIKFGDYVPPDKKIKVKKHETRRKSKNGS
jgi:hypothetical protein